MEQPGRDTLEYQLFYRRRLPHYQPGGATFFLTYRLAGSLPAHVMRALWKEARRAWDQIDRLPETPERETLIYRQQRRLFGLWDRALHQTSSGPFWLRDPQIAALVVESLHFHDGRRYDLAAFCIMPNHVHVLFTPRLDEMGSYHSLAKIQHSIKRHTARLANAILERTGDFWYHENYDHMVRDATEFERIRAYILNNPAKAGLVKNWQEWPWSEAKGMDGKTSYFGPLP